MIAEQAAATSEVVARGRILKVITPLHENSSLATRYYAPRYTRRYKLTPVQLLQECFTSVDNDILSN